MTRSRDQSEATAPPQPTATATYPRARQTLGEYFASTFRRPRDYLPQLLGIISTLAITVLAIFPTAGTTLAATWPVVLFTAIGIVAGAALLAVPREKYRSLFAKHFGWLPVTAGLATYPLMYWTASRLDIEPASQFFEISAQVLPVVLLAAVIDVRRSRYLKSYQLALPIFVVFLGEMAALNILVRQPHFTL